MIAAVPVLSGCKQAAGASSNSEGKTAPGRFAVTFSVDGDGGTLKATTGGSEINSGDKVEHGKTVTFTAAPANTEYSVEKWTITGGTFETGGTEGSSTATVKITAETTVKVSFTRHKSVAFGTNGADLDNYLKNKSPASDGIYYIEVTGLQAANLKGDPDNNKTSPLGEILIANRTKKVALKLGGGITGLTDMSKCFEDCVKLTQGPEIPASVKKMSSCFYGCKALKSVVLKCKYNSGEFNDAFKRCNLPAGGIKVLHDYLPNYTTNAGAMGAEADWFAE